MVICFVWDVTFCALDVIGVMTGISAERQYVRDGKMTKMVVIELTVQRFVPFS
jgi:hypothetical protein